MIVVFVIYFLKIFNIVSIKHVFITVDSFERNLDYFLKILPMIEESKQKLNL